MTKRILISTGGSGGHVVPATILYEHLKDEFNVSMSTDYRGMKFLDKDKYNLKIFNINPISKNIFLIPFQFFLIIYLIIKSIFFLKKSKIDILISTGGYMSLPLCLASKILDIKLFLFEPNMVLGRSNKFFIKSCEKIFCYSSKIKNFPKKCINKICVIPALLRKNFYDLKKTEGIDKNINLLIIGGSQGAKIFDTLIKSSIIELSKKYSLKIYQQTNSVNFEALKKLYKDKNIDCELFYFNEDISDRMSKSNICITRAGASTLAELVFLNLPSVAIPLPTSKDNHQFENAFFYNEIGCNWILNQNEIKDETLTNKLFNIIDNKDEFLAKKKNMKNFSYQNTWNNINQKIISVINENRISKN
ncbi:UDP-N-acetylglucosamine--N-acetylmuramyl-(pentapeptide) pyrophosphoryl-undecaprenol N-acetylglucosamine transferase [Candidatus Pelagibacter sp.]|jgi:UDP-N-acetylglucosamine--N-acetylmuramyl-(pentapeptide) pyrophosphoryl-undecaprenol N-acetylglucosamine transferase|nr:UDP-N-acetylglucosamine--N-acetylmuramyl-(pentapeptide) pyrophosphoryl-undecaprenol N-acetylglucosamine transferase [Candidatus Pelagibacter sp.]